ncbi:hypothetical protein [Aliamphritea spongicola]|uniref:hypothetical protein n=1 Tax=Aliamphritea spongicola TaxID=707589 RepID=UPI00196AAF2F|nr:hypothetical protein [Aliamphritea spongicola]MBN3561084.1 hypothetical protein [Aliamphritea spongicola]
MEILAALQVLAVYGEQQDQAFEALIDSQDGALHLVSLKDVYTVLDRYLSGSLTEDDLEDWAMLLDSRDEFDCSTVEDYIYALNNPDLMGGISHSAIATMADLVREQLTG